MKKKKVSKYTIKTKRKFAITWLRIAHGHFWGSVTWTSRPVVPGCAGCAMAHPDFGRSVNPISTRGDRLCPPNY